MANFIDVNSYYEMHSEKAAEFERSGNYAKAQIEWDDAARFSTKAKQTEWCIARANFCDRMVRRPFRGV